MVVVGSYWFLTTTLLLTLIPTPARLFIIAALGLLAWSIFARRRVFKTAARFIVLVTFLMFLMSVVNVVILVLGGIGR